MVVVYKKVTLNNFISLIKLKYLFKMIKYIKLYIKNIYINKVLIYKTFHNKVLRTLNQNK